MKKTLILLCASVFMLTAWTVQAAEKPEDMPPPQKERIAPPEQRLADDLGLSDEQKAQAEKLRTESREKMLEKMEEKPDRLAFNDLNQLVLYYGTIEVRLGDDENMDEKINRLVGILPELEGMSGILHLENTTEDSESVVFDDATQAEDQETVQESESSQETQEDTGGDQLDYSDGSDSADTRSMEE